LAAALLLGVGRGAAQEAPPEDSDPATFVMKQLVDIEARLLADASAARLENLEAQQVAASAVGRAAREVADAVRALQGGELTEREAEAARRQLEAAEARLLRAQQDLDRLAHDAARLVAAAGEHAARLLQLRAQHAALEARPAPPEAALTGSWDVAIAPIGDRGWFKLDQRGTLVSGQYGLASGRGGSLQGTFVGGRLQLEQIDAKQGRDAVFYALLVPETGALKGTWESRLLGTGRPAYGSWSGVKKPRASEAEAAAGAPPPQEPP
jgi:hypothetical protein